MIDIMILCANPAFIFSFRLLALLARANHGNNTVSTTRMFMAKIQIQEISKEKKKVVGEEWPCRWHERSVLTSSSLHSRQVQWPCKMKWKVVIAQDKKKYYNLLHSTLFDVPALMSSYAGNTTSFSKITLLLPHCTAAPHCTARHYMAPHCTALHCTARHRTTLTFEEELWKVEGRALGKIHRYTGRRNSMKGITMNTEKGTTRKISPTVRRN